MHYTLVQGLFAKFGYHREFLSGLIPTPYQVSASYLKERHTDKHTHIDSFNFGLCYGHFCRRVSRDVARGRGLEPTPVRSSPPWAPPPPMKWHFACIVVYHLCMESCRFEFSSALPLPLRAHEPSCRPLIFKSLSGYVPAELGPTLTRRVAPVARPSNSQNSTIDYISWWIWIGIWFQVINLPGQLTFKCNLWHRLLLQLHSLSLEFRPYLSLLYKLYNTCICE